MLLKVKLTFLLMLLGLLAKPFGLVLADDIKLQFEFIKKPPSAGIFFAVEGEPANKQDVVDQLNKKFTKSIIVTDNAGSIIFKNGDDVEHNIYAQDADANVQFDVGLMPVGSEKKLDVNWKQGTLVRIGCKIHPRMRAYVANFNSDTYQVIEFDRSQKISSYQLTGVDEEQIKFQLLLPKYQSIEFEIKPGEEKQFKLIRASKERGHVTITRQ